MLSTLLLWCVAWMLCAQAPPPAKHGNDNAFNTVSYRTLAPLKVNGEQGVSAPFAGSIHQNLIVAGGCNFPNVPAAKGGAKRFYADIYELPHPDHDPQAQWRKIGELPQPMAYGVSVTVPNGMVCVGGTTDGVNSCAETYLLHTDAHHKLQITPLPALPLSLDNLTGAYGGGYIYVAGGQHNGVAVNAAFRLQYPGGKAWERLPDFPGRARVQPASAVQNNATAPCFYLVGGFAPATKTERAWAHTDGWCFNAATRQWSKMADIVPHGQTEPMTLAGAIGISSGCAHIVFVGGVNKQVFEQAVNRPLLIEQTERCLQRTPTLALQQQLERLNQEQAAYLNHAEGWYRFNNELVIYHTITDTWVTESQSPLMARAGAGFIRCGREWIVVNGETKPGIRSAAVTAVKMDMRPTFGWINWTVLIAYLVGMVLLGYYFMRREGDADDFFKGGGRIPWWAAGISIYATMLSAITYMAYPAKAYATDWTYYPMLVTILLVSFPVIKYYLPFFP